MACLDFIRQQLETTTAGAIAAVIVEPMQGTAGNVIPPPEFLPGVQEIARENDALLIADEMITGFGRTGEMFGCDHTDTEPDVMTIGKGFGNGFPVTGLISTDEIIAASPVRAAELVVVELRRQSARRDRGARHDGDDRRRGADRECRSASARCCSTSCATLQEKYEFIGDVRGKGLLIGMDLVKDRETKEPLSAEVGEEIFLGALRRGLLLMGYFSRVRINPPLVLTEDEARDGVAILDEVFAEVARDGHYRR